MGQRIHRHEQRDKANIAFCVGATLLHSRSYGVRQNSASLLPNIGKLADDICLIRSMQTSRSTTDPDDLFATGQQQPGGGWDPGEPTGLGSENESPGTSCSLRGGGGHHAGPLLGAFFPSHHHLPYLLNNFHLCDLFTLPFTSLQPPTPLIYLPDAFFTAFLLHAPPTLSFRSLFLHSTPPPSRFIPLTPSTTSLPLHYLISSLPFSLYVLGKAFCPAIPRRPPISRPADRCLPHHRRMYGESRRQKSSNRVQEA